MTAGKGMSKLRDDGRHGVSTGIVNSRQKLPVFATVDLILRICAADGAAIPNQRIDPRTEPSFC
jgi:hypothetical protein